MERNHYLSITSNKKIFGHFCPNIFFYYVQLEYKNRKEGKKMKKRFDINDFELATNESNEYVIIKYKGNDRIVYLPNSVMNVPIVGIHKKLF